MEKRSESSNWVPGFAVLLAVLLGCVWLPGAQTAWALASPEWAWMKGSNSSYSPAAVYGPLGIQVASNTPGWLTDSVSWTDTSGGLWLYGGVGLDSGGNQKKSSDLWRYDPATGCWAWINGSKILNQSATYGTLGTPAAANTPGGRAKAVSWTDASGALWLFGGSGPDVAGDAPNFNDLWKYTPSTGNWTWIKGANTANQAGTYGTLGTPAAANTPGARSDAVAWSDGAGGMWLFGGTGCDGNGSTGYLNDLWKYTPSTGNWTWMKGANTTNRAGTYGTLRTAAEANTPGARNGAVSWTDASGALWLYGGFGYDGAGNPGNFNDLWKYTPSTGNWTWMKGANTTNQAGNYGTLRTAAEANTPGARRDAASWTDASGALWLYGGGEWATWGDFNNFSDLWRYDPVTGYWAWMNGSNAINQPATYGTLGTPAAANTPGWRRGAVSWTGNSNTFWLFGGWTTLNDSLWRCTAGDTTPPTGTIIINDNKSCTNSRNVTVGLTWADNAGGSGVARMRFSNDGSTWSAYESLTPSRSYTLPVGDDGYRTVRVQFIDLANNRSATYSDYIRLDRSVPTGGITINNGAATTTTRSVTLKLNYADTGSGVVRMRFSDNGSTWTNWMYPTATKAYKLPKSEPGYQTVRVQYLDGANNYSPVYNDYIKLVSP